MVVGLIPCIPRDLQGQSPEKQKVGQKTERDYANEAWMDGYKHLYKDEASLCREGLIHFPGDPDLRELLAEGLSNLGQYEEAEILFKGILNSEKGADKAIYVWARPPYVAMLRKQNRNAEADAVAQNSEDVARNH